MRHSRFWELMAGEFGAAYAPTLARSHVLSALGGRTPDEALRSGMSPREVWDALCEDQDVPESRRHGLDPAPRRP
ncbi:DUF3046 domain-containing protein [Phycicoccus duodecadis]|uniref:DUF3046 family protein n=1 Tax=Phycicoccus duodecadis TaxID=173053 RepID=A0A2N3YMT1_9MICO|nr:DUF3046 domain-containing protein [Phycicoccus duodecadis]PKW28146.1 Protein of unknown function (DUF3046) [Phycicoccus duodecadis]